MNPESRYDHAPIDDNERVGAAREKFFAQAEMPDGVTCPVCERYGKVYRRKLNSTMAMTLAVMYRVARQRGDVYRWLKLDEFIKKRQMAADYGKLAYWGLIKADTPEKGRLGKGRWGLTPLGVEFVTGHALVPRYITVYNGKPRDASIERTTIRAALGDHFDFHRLMEDQGYFGPEESSGQSPKK